MGLINKTKKYVFIAILLASGLNVAAQDLLARQAPVDRKMKAVDTLLLHNIIEKENMESPAAQLYDNWNNQYAHAVSALPDTFTIDLRHFCMPTPSRVITSTFGSRWGRQHKGLDLKVYIGDTIKAAFSGKVCIVKYEARGYGKYVVIRHNNGLETVYGHLSKQLVKENQEVRAGEAIGLGGNTGRSTGSHLHFETRLCGVALNPALLFDFRAQDVTADFYTFRSSQYAKESAEANRTRGKIDRSKYLDDEDGGEMADNRSAEDILLASKTRYHKVEQGETLQSIARKRGVTVEQICRLSHINKSTTIRPGTILRYS